MPRAMANIVGRSVCASTSTKEKHRVPFYDTTKRQRAHTALAVAPTKAANVPFPVPAKPAFLLRLGDEEAAPPLQSGKQALLLCPPSHHHHALLRKLCSLPAPFVRDM